ncbi:MAG: hypothetical protein IJ025_09115 [Clostridia bacterium]|nr:hypothetical protein [Clostridia bacterium]
MKKAYIAPESALYEINLSEKIATGSPGGSVAGDQISGSVNIYFSHGEAPCRDYYQGEFDAPVGVLNGTWIDYFMELHGMNKPNVLQKCIGA